MMKSALQHFFFLLAAVQEFFQFHLCCMQFFSSVKGLQESFSKSSTPPPQELNGRPLIDSSRSRFPLWRLLLISRPPTRSEFVSRNFLHAYACLFVYFVCVSVLGRPEYAANPNRCYWCNRSGHWAKDCSFIVDFKYFHANGRMGGKLILYWVVVDSMDWF